MYHTLGSEYTTAAHQRHGPLITDTESLLEGLGELRDGGDTVLWDGVLLATVVV